MGSPHVKRCFSLYLPRGTTHKQKSQRSGIHLAGGCAMNAAGTLVQVFLLLLVLRRWALVNGTNWRSTCPPLAALAQPAYRDLLQWHRLCGQQQDPESAHPQETEEPRQVILFTMTCRGISGISCSPCQERTTGLHFGRIPPQRIRSVVPQCVDGIQVGGLPGGKVAKDNADARRHAEGDGHRRRAGADGDGSIRHEGGDDRCGDGG